MESMGPLVLVVNLEDLTAQAAMTRPRRKNPRRKSQRLKNPRRMAKFVMMNMVLMGLMVISPHFYRSQLVVEQLLTFVDMNR